MTAHKSHSSRSIVRMGYASVVLASFGTAILEDMRIGHENVLRQATQPSDDIVAAASSYPVPDFSSLLIEYRAASTVRPGHPEDWEFTCSRCGINFTVTHGELI
jgi:hypothetical protein